MGSATMSALLEIDDVTGSLAATLYALAAGIATLYLLRPRDPPGTTGSVIGPSAPMPDGVNRESAFSRRMATICSVGRCARARLALSAARSKDPRPTAAARSPVTPPLSAPHAGTSDVARGHG